MQYGTLYQNYTKQHFIYQIIPEKNTCLVWNLQYGHHIITLCPEKFIICEFMDTEIHLQGPKNFRKGTCPAKGTRPTLIFTRPFSNQFKLK